eukprot:scaffold1074_cov409-Prasinococcus_capsulatus_cf.AAC.25
MRTRQNQAQREQLPRQSMTTRGTTPLNASTSSISSALLHLISCPTLSAEDLSCDPGAERDTSPLSLTSRASNEASLQAQGSLSVGLATPLLLRNVLTPASIEAVNVSFLRVFTHRYRVLSPSSALLPACAAAPDLPRVAWAVLRRMAARPGRSRDMPASSTRPPQLPRALTVTAHGPLSTRPASYCTKSPSAASTRIVAELTVGHARTSMMPGALQRSPIKLDRVVRRPPRRRPNVATV